MWEVDLADVEGRGEGVGEAEWYHQLCGVSPLARLWLRHLDGRRMTSCSK